MSTAITFNNVQYNVPAFGDGGYAQGPGNMSAYWIALSTGTLQQSGGNFTLTADVNFGPNFGLLAKYFTSVTSTPATAGSIRLAKTDTIDWRNNANSANLALGINGSDQLTFAGSAITVGGVTSITGTANQIIASSSTGAVTLSTPQDIGTTSAVHFGTVTVGAGNGVISNPGSSPLQIASGSGIKLRETGGVGIITDGTLVPQTANGNDIGASANPFRSVFLKTNLSLLGSTSGELDISAAATTSSYAVSMPSAQGAATSVLTNNGSGVLSWVVPTGSGTVNAGTAGQLAYYATSGSAISSAAFLSYSAPVLTLTAGAAQSKLQITSTGANSAIASFLANSHASSIVADSAGNLLIQDNDAPLSYFQYLKASTSLVLNAPTSIAGAVNMNSNKITALANGTASSDAIAFGQLFYGGQAAVQATGTSTTTFGAGVSTFTATVVTASITPTTNTRRIKIVASFTAQTNNNIGQFTLERGTTNLMGASGGAQIGSATVITLDTNICLTFIDSPATTSATSYTVYGLNASGANNVNVGNGKTWVITLEEII